MTIPQVLTIAGSDSGGGAGIQADLKTFQMRGVFGTSVITAVTAQNTLGVFAIHPVPRAIIQAQLKAVAEDFTLSAVKIGMLGNTEIIDCVAEGLEQYSLPNIILDPVMVAKGGSPLLQRNAVTTLKKRLIPKAHVITPNIPEAEIITGIKIRNEQAVFDAAEILHELGAKTVIIKGGHLENSQSVRCKDWFFSPQNHFVLESPRIDTRHTHGTGCTFSACIAAETAKGKGIEQAVRIAKDYISAAIGHSLNIGHGHGPTNHWGYQDE